MSTGVAILGAGIFASEEHLPAVKACSLLSLKAVYSRSLSSAKSLAGSDTTIATYYSEPPTPGQSLDDLLARADIQAVIIALPIPLQPEFIKKALAAGKHVLSEKPIAKDFETAEALVQWHKSLNGNALWSVGENMRFLEPLSFGATELAKMGEIQTFSLNFYTMVADDDKFFNTPWRKVPQYQGGFLLDGGIHFVAGMRHLLSSKRQDITRLSAHTSLQHAKLLPVDTVHAVAQITNGKSGSLNISFGTEFKSQFDIEVITTDGAVRVGPTEVTVVRKDEKGALQESKKSFDYKSGIVAEVAAFAKSVEAKKVDRRGTVEEGLADLEILQRMLESGEEGGVKKEMKYLLFAQNELPIIDHITSGPTKSGIDVLTLLKEHMRTYTESFSRPTPREIAVALAPHYLPHLQCFVHGIVTQIPESTKVDTFEKQFQAFRDQGIQMKILGTRSEKVSETAAVAWVKIEISRGENQGSRKEFESLYGFRVLDNGRCGWEWAIADQEVEALAS